jgi:hypothetical protein
MASNGKPQFVRHVFSLQSNGAAAEAVDATVVQDKARFARARTATHQPGAETKCTRAAPVNSTLPRSQNRLTHTKRTEKLTLWVEPIVKEELARIAKQEGLSLSKSGAAFLKRSLQQHIDLAYSALLTPIIEAAIERRMRARENRFAWLMVRNIFASEQTRAIVANILGRQQDMTEAELKHILAMTKRTAHATLTRRNPELEELTAAVKQWLDEAETENHPPQATDVMAGVHTTEPSH